MRKENIFKESVRYIQAKIKNTLDNVPAGDMKRIKDLFLKADRVFVYGAGRSGLVAKAFAIRLVHLGFQCFVIGETITAPVKKGDLVLVISGTGKTIPVVMTAQIANNLKAKIIAITGDKKSELIKYADIALVMSSNHEEEKRKKFAPLGTLFESTTWILLDGLIADLMHAKNETEENMKQRHATL